MAKFKPCPQCQRLMTAEGVCPHCQTPFGNVAFDPERKEDGPTNGQMAAHGELILALSCINESLVPVIAREKVTLGPKALGKFSQFVNLTEAPEEALADLLTNLMHYCHREGIEWFGDNGVSQTALRNFSAESGGAVL